MEAIKQVKIHRASIRQAAIAHKMSRATLGRYIEKFDGIDVATANNDFMKILLMKSSKRGAKTIFDLEEEMALIKYILQASDIYYGVSLRKLRKLAYEYAKIIGISYPDAWDVHCEASSDWQLGFMKRYPNLILRKPENVILNRAKAFNKESVDFFFKNLSSVLNATNFEPQRIYNMDQCGLPTVPGKAVEITSLKGKQSVGTAMSQERATDVTMALSVSATGQSIPPFYLFPRMKMKEVFMTHASPGAVGIANGSGLMTSEEFTKYMHHFIKHTGANAECPTLLLLNNHTLHLSIESLDLAVQHGITMKSFPPHCTHRMQPLDITVFGPFQTAYAIEHDAWQKNNIGMTFDLHHVPLVAGKCLDVAVTQKNIKAGFQAAGICPFNPNAFTELDFVASQLSEENDHDYDKDADNASSVHSTGAGSSTSSSSSTASVVSDKDLPPLKANTLAKKSAVLTSPKVVPELLEKAEKKLKRETKKENKPASKKRKVCSQSKEDDEEKDADVSNFFSL